MLHETNNKKIIVEDTTIDFQSKIYYFNFQIQMWH